ncbi:MAG: thioredoxin family protein [Ignavibacteriales bacterium]|nr:thioredoxin family protein [Ignavibacteriales bacterium]
MIIKVLGSGCTNCKTLELRTKEAVEELHIEAVIEKVQDYQEIASYGVLRTPGLVIDGKVVSVGAVPKVDEIKNLILKQTATV